MNKRLIPLLACVLLGWQLQAGEPMLVKEPEKPVSLQRLPDGLWQADFGRDAFGQIELTLQSRSGGDTVFVHLGERLVDGRIWRKPTTTVRYRRIPVVLQPGRHTYHLDIEPDRRNTGRDAVKMPADIGEVLPFRYCEVEGYEGLLRRSALTRLSVHVPFNDKAARFRSDDDILNQVWELCRYSVKATTFTGYYVDGDRERIPYEADALISQLCHYAADTEFTTARRTLEHLLEHPTWPTEWILQCVLIAWNDYLYSGDDTLLRTHYDMLKAHCLLDLREDCGLISTTTGRQTPEFLASIRRSGTIRDIVDWPHTGGTGLQAGQGGEDDGFVYTDFNAVVNAWFYKALTCMTAIAEHLDRAADAAEFAAAAAKVREVFDTQLYDPARGVYRDGLDTDHSALHTNVFALLFGLVPQERQARVVEFIKSRGMACSVYGAQFLLEALYEAGEADYAYSLLTDQSLRSWYNMIRVGSTITLEAWDDSFKPNQDWNHLWGAAPGNIIPFRLMGVQPLEPGFARVRIHPQTGPLRRADVTVPTCRGPIRVRVRGDKVRVRVPKGVEYVLD